MAQEKQFHTIHMCDYCSFEITNCNADPVFSEALKMESGKLKNPRAVVACDKYKNPVDVLKKQFH